MKRESKRIVPPVPRRSAPGSSGKASKNRATLSQLLAAVGFRNLALGVLLLLVTVIAYTPALNGGLLWDDDQHVTKPALQSFHGLWRIWFDLGSTAQYY